MSNSTTEGNFNNIYNESKLYKYEENYNDVDMKKNELNPFFFSNNLKTVRYESYIYPLSYEKILEEDIDLKIDLVKQFDEGNLYTLELIQDESLNDLDRISMGKQYLGYFYVTENGIYLRPTDSYDGYEIEETAYLINLLMEKDENYLDNFWLVCSDDEMCKKENEWVWEIEVNGDERTFKHYSTYTSGTREYLLITWELGKGITHYITGDGSMRMHTEFGTDLKNQRYTEINEYPWFPE